MTPADIVEAILDILDGPEHWCKHELWRFEGNEKQYCLMGALNEVAFGHASGVLPIMFDYDSKKYSTARQVLHVMDRTAKEMGYDNPGMPVGFGAPTVEFNNAPETEYEDIRLFLKEVLVKVSA